MRVCPRCHGRYEGEPRFCPRDGAPLASDIDPRLGQVLFGQFELREVCGKGAMGTVYRAWQTGMERQVAVKVLRSELLREPAVVKRFFREARSVARMQHPNIVTVFLVGETDDRMPYIVMEYVEGIALAELAASEGVFEPARALRIGRQIASALADAHHAGIVHRDLKPANILITQRRRAADFVKVLDFGIAKVLHGDEVEQGALSNLTRTGTIFGTPHYISPEQAQGGDIDHRADLYSLGVIMYRLLCGRLPFEGTGIAVLLQHMNQPPPAPRELRPELDAEIETFLLRALAKQPEARFQSAEEMSDAIDVLMPAQWVSWTSSLPATPSPPPSQGRGDREIGGRTVPGIMPAKGDEKGARPTVAASGGAKRGRVSARGSGVEQAVEGVAAGESPAPRASGESATTQAPAGQSGAFFARGDAEVSDEAGDSRDAPLYLDEGPSGWDHQARRRRGTWIAIAVGVLAAGLAVVGGYLFGRSRGAPDRAEAAMAPPAAARVDGEGAPAPEPASGQPPGPAAAPDAPAATVTGEQISADGATRMMTLGEAGYAIRVTLPSRFVAGKEHEFLFEIRDPKGTPLGAKTVGAALEEPDGVNRTMTLRASAVGRYTMRRRFPAEGRYHIHIYPVVGKTSPRVWFDAIVEPASNASPPTPAPAPPSPPLPTGHIVPAHEPVPSPSKPADRPIEKPIDKPVDKPADLGNPYADPPPDTSKPGPPVPDPLPDPEPDPYRIIDETPAPDAGLLE